MSSPADFRSLLPLELLLAAPTLLILLISLRRSHLLAAGVTAASLVLAIASIPYAAGAIPRDISNLLLVDRFALFYIALICAGALACAVIAYAYLERSDGRREEFYVLLLAATLGGGVLAASHHFAPFFLGLELMSVSLFALVAYPMQQALPLEAGVKYLVLAGASSALMAFGIALVYFGTGSLEFGGSACPGAWASGEGSWLPLAGNALLLAGLGFKLSLVPFHLWAPDVYEGAPAPAAAFLATVSKGAVAALLLRYAGSAGFYEQPALLLVLQIAALLSIAAGNLLALMQDNLKRLLAYSSIAHLGYVLIAIIAGGPFGAEAVGYYLLAYFLMNLGAFGVIAALSVPGRDGDGRDTDSLDDYRGLFWRRPWLAGILALNLLSLAGIPLTVGFIAKFYLFASGVAATRWLLLAALVVGSVVGLFYYLRVVISLFAQVRPVALPGLGGTLPAWASALTLSFLALSLLWLGVYPEPAMRLIRAANGNASRVGPARPLMTPAARRLETIAVACGEEGTKHGNEDRASHGQCGPPGPVVRPGLLR